MSKFIKSNSIDLPEVDLGGLDFLDELASPLWIYDFDSFAIRWANRVALTFWGADSLAALQARAMDPHTEGVRTRLANLRFELAKGARVTEQWTLFPGGQPSPTLCSCRGVHLADGHFAMLVEAQVAAQEPVLATELRTVEAIRHTPLMISMFTPEGRVLMRNPSASELANKMGLSEQGLADAYSGLFADPVRAQRLRRDALSRGSSEAVLTLAGKPARIHHVSLRRVYDPLSGGSALLVAQQDITKMHRLEQRLQRALDRERETSETQRHFLSIASHEFKTPLSVIDGSAQRILRSMRDPEPALAERIASIRNAVGRIGHAVDNTLAMIRIDERKIGCVAESCDLGALVAQVCETHSILSRDRVIQTDLPDFPALMLDPHLTGQVLENILSNAIKYSPPETPVSIRGQVGDRYVSLEIRDHGIGIPKADLDKLFTRFFRAGNVGSIPGTGIGLNTVRYFMQLQGGRVRIHSREGHGTSVELSFRR